MKSSYLRRRRKYNSNLVIWWFPQVSPGIYQWELFDFLLRFLIFESFLVSLTDFVFEAHDITIPTLIRLLKNIIWKQNNSWLWISTLWDSLTYCLGKTIPLWVEASFSAVNLSFISHSRPFSAFKWFISFWLFFKSSPISLLSSNKSKY